jgi:hypothetical protein
MCDAEARSVAGRPLEIAETISKHRATSDLLHQGPGHISDDGRALLFGPDQARQVTSKIVDSLNIVEDFFHGAALFILGSVAILCHKDGQLPAKAISSGLCPGLVDMLEQSIESPGYIVWVPIMTPSTDGFTVSLSDMLDVSEASNEWICRI